MLQARGLPVPAEVAARVRATRDPSVLESWLRRAATGDDADRLFE